jgi:L-lactate dehydrogenase complex protein LldG
MTSTKAEVLGRMSRDLILQEICSSKLMKTSLPEIDIRQFSADSDLRDTFARNVEAVGGKSISVSDEKEILENIQNLFPDAKEIISLVKGVGIGSIDINKISTAQELDKLDLCVIGGQFGVAENGAVWISDGNFDHRAIPFIASHVVIVLDEEDIVENMHEACQRIAGFNDGYGVFVSGPSKTADIEQSLVIGAQGPMSLTVFVVNRHSES